jgi:hypothetical protein
MSEWSNVEIQSWCSMCQSSTDSLQELPHDSSSIGRDLRRQFSERLSGYCKGGECPGLTAAFAVLLAGKWTALVPAKQKGLSAEPEGFALEDSDWLTVFLNLSFYLFAFLVILFAQRPSPSYLLSSRPMLLAVAGWLFLFGIVISVKGKKTLFRPENKAPLLRGLVCITLVFAGTLGLSFALGGGFYGAFGVWLIVMWLGGIPLFSLETYRSKGDKS